MRRFARQERFDREGYVLIELMLALMLMAILASLALPGFVRGTGLAALRITAFEVAALLREDRNQAISSNRVVTTLTAGTRIESGFSAGSIVMPMGVTLNASPTILFMPDGHISGADVVLASNQARLTVELNRDTGAIRVVAP